MRNKIITIIILLIALSLMTIGIIQGQHDIINIMYDKMAIIP
jgi:hypothetical protein